ncbi:MAG TPA: hypothetical protein ACFYEK_07130 [Candidatus Wunengus sp. YC60]|uniref:hypothetical protein n=1 Tax=Candidatus Wunengus sp. YC60 TaxID=3367697 RepID=UPI004026ED10
MIQIILLVLLGLLAAFIAVITGVLGSLWLLLFKQELNLPFGKKQNNPPQTPS